MKSAKCFTITPNLLTKMLCYAWMFFFVFSQINPSTGSSQSLNIPSKHFGLSIGNSKKFKGFRINFRDHKVEEINGINVTLWRSKNNRSAEVNGISLGIMPDAGYLNGIQLGALGVGADKKVSGVSLGLLGVGAGTEINGIAIGGLGAGSGVHTKGLVIGGLGAGSGGNMTGISIGGLGAGAGGDMTGISVGGLGAGAGGNMSGLSIGGLGAGAGGNLTGITIGGLGAGAGGNITGLTIAGIGAGCGGELKGITLGGIAAGAPKVTGLTIGGFAVGGVQLQGIQVATAWIKVENEGNLKGFCASAFNQIKGTQTGISLGIFNFAYKLNGIQFGVLNYVRDNPPLMKILPLLNFNFD